MSKEDLKDVCTQITEFTVSWNSCSHKHISYDAMRELTKFLWEYFSIDFEEYEE